MPKRILDKEATSYYDILDAYRLAIKAMNLAKILLVDVMLCLHFVLLITVQLFTFVLSDTQIKNR
jgi:hypothetical protein